MVTKTKTKTIDWPGKSGRTYTHYIYPIGTDFKACAGNYVFAKESSPGRWLPVYIGQTGNLAERFDDHHAMPCIKRAGATHIHAHRNDDKNARLTEERDLIDKWAPPCNKV